MTALPYDIFTASQYIESLNVNMDDLVLMRSLSIGYYVDGWAHAFAFCNNCDRYHTVSQGDTCHDGGSLMHRTNAQTNYLYIPDPVVPILSPPLIPADGADAAEESDEGENPSVGQPHFFLLAFADDDDETLDGEATEEIQ